jgi:tetratricopeptide (TPR) repeat protein
MRGALRALAALGLGACALACATRVPTVAPPPAAALRLSSIAGEGDARRRASQQLVLSGLDADVLGKSAEALPHYEDALKVDPNNPFAYLALARHEIFSGDPDRGLAALDRFVALAPPAEASAAHVAGLRGAALLALGKSALAKPFLEEARALAPAQWGDARLDAQELR